MQQRRLTQYTILLVVSFFPFPLPVPSPSAARPAYALLVDLVSTRKVPVHLEYHGPALVEQGPRLPDTTRPQEREDFKWRLALVSQHAPALEVVKVTTVGRIVDEEASHLI